MPCGARDGVRGTPGVDGDQGWARQRKRVLQDFRSSLQDFAEDTGEGRTLPNQGVTYVLLMLTQALPDRGGTEHVSQGLGY